MADEYGYNITFINGSVSVSFISILQTMYTKLDILETTNNIGCITIDKNIGVVICLIIVIRGQYS